jgi:purine-binding chemotaxis protein CheW
MIDLHTNMMTKTYTHGELQLVVFHIGTDVFGVEIKKVQEIIRMPRITEIPRAPSFVKGVINLRGRIIVVISLNVIMGIGCGEYNTNTRIIVVDIDSTVMGFLVESVSEVLRISYEDVEPVPPLITNKIRSEYLEGVCKLDDRLLILLNIDRMLNADELQKIHSISPEA